MSACCDSDDHVSLVPLSSSVGTVIDGNTDRASGRCRRAFIWRAKDSAVARCTIAFKAGMTCATRSGDAPIMGGNHSSASAAIPCLRASRTRRPRLSYSDSRGGWTPVFKRARAVTRCGASRHTSSATRPPMEWPASANRGGAAANTWRAMSVIEENPAKDMTCALATEARRLGTSAQMVSSHKRPHNRISGCIPYYIAAAMPQEQEAPWKMTFTVRCAMFAFGCRRPRSSYPTARPIFAFAARPSPPRVIGISRCNECCGTCPRTPERLRAP